MNNKELLEKLGAPFPPEAFETDDSRGFNLTGIKTLYVIERLNEVFGPCGTGWGYTIRNMTITDDWVAVDVELRYRLNGDEWSEPIVAFGDCRIVRGRVGDARKGALSDAIKKAASFLGVGNEAYKGLLRSGGTSAPRAKPRSTAAPSPKAKATAPKQTSEESHPWHLCVGLINRIRKEIPYFGGNVPHILNALRKLEAEGVIAWNQDVDEVFEAVNEYAHKRANEKAAKG